MEPSRAGVLAYLALEGPTDRLKLSQLLWEGAPPTRARNNLARLVFRLRQSHPGVCVVGPGSLSLAEDVVVDVSLLEATAERQDHRSAVPHAGVFLEGCAFEAAEQDAGRCELQDWMERQRNRLRELQRVAHLGLIRQLDQERRLPEALELAKKACSLFPEKEDAWHSRIQLHRVMGDQDAALEAFRE
ncbi:MAG TPA: hypothetical protein VIG99_18510, partial [Myxococcaceae bacterium]